MLKRPVGRPPFGPSPSAQSHPDCRWSLTLIAAAQRTYASFRYQAQSWTMPRRVVAKVEWHPGELYPRVGFIVTNMTRPAERVVSF